MSDHPPGHDDVRLTIEVTTEPDVNAAVVTPHGDIDLTTSEALRVAVNRIIDDGTTAIVLDLSDVPFADSTALAVLVVLHRRLGGRLVIAAAQPAVLRLFEITKFTSVFWLTDSVAAALTELRA